jgi:hypothetical protein
MKKAFSLIALFLAAALLHAQDDGRVLLRGQVLYRNSNVPNENVINSTAETATITGEDGRFAILVKTGDELIFTSLNYQLEIVPITEEILQNNRLVVEVNEKVTELDEVVVSPEDQQRFIQLKNEEFKQYAYETDATSEVTNIALDPTVRGMQDGLNFVNIFKALSKLGQGEQPEAARDSLKLSQVLRQVYDDRFFVSDLNIPQDKIDDFLFYLDDKTPARTLLRKDNEFQLIEYLVTESKQYLTQLNAGE